MKYPLSLTPLLPVAGCLAAGILFSIALPTNYLLTATIICISIAVVTALFNRRVTAVMIGAFCLGMATYIVHDHHKDASIIVGREVTAEGYIESVGESNTAQILTVAISSFTPHDSDRSISAGGLKASVAYPSFTPEMLKGETVKLTGTFFPVESHPIVPDETDIPASMRSRGILVQTLVKPDSLTYLPDSPTYHAKIARIARHITDIIYRSPLNPTTKEFLATAIMGDSQSLTAESREEFTRAGIAHILALSGLHAGIIASLALIILWPLKLTRAGKFIPLIIIILLWVFAILTGLSPSVTRAVIMASTFLGARMLQRRHSAINALSLAAIIILVFDPLAIQSTSFLLSFSAVAGIIIFAEKLNPVSRRHRIPYTIASLITVTIAAMLATALISACVFHTFPVYFLLANLLTAPLLPLIIGGGVIMICLGAFDWYPATICTCIDFLNSILTKITHFIAHLPGAMIDNIYLSEAAITVIAVAIISFALWLHFRRAAYSIATIIAVGFAAGLCLLPQPPIDDFGARIVAQPYHTNIVVSSPEALHIITTAKSFDFNSVENDARKLYHNHIGRRGIPTVMVNSRQSQSRYHKFDYPLLVTQHHTIYIADNDATLSSSTNLIGQPDILLVCRGFRDDIISLIVKLQPKNIFLSSDIDKRRAHRYEQQLQDFGCDNVRNLATHPFSVEDAPL